LAVTVQRFLKEYPEFKSTDYQLVEQKLNHAILRVDSGTFGDLEEEAVMLKTAHLLSISPSGEKTRLVKDSNKTIYEKEYRLLAKEATFGLGRNS
jgi:hypothetical protein